MSRAHSKRFITSLEISSLLSFPSWHLIKEFAKIDRALEALTFVCQDAFDSLKNAICSDSLLASSRIEKSLIFDTDFSPKDV